ncbi:MAG: endonuclease/exonuclease/phosphatase family protein [Puniceicoccaceae bacterium]
MKRVDLLLAFLVAAPFALADIDRPSVAIWNLRNLSIVDRFEEGRYRFAYPMPEVRKQAIRQLLLQERPSLLFLQEVGSPAFLEELRLDLAAGGLVYSDFAFSGHPESRTGLAVLSRFTLAEVVFHQPDGIRRGIQEVALVINATRFRFFHVHLKSRYSTDPGDPDARRERLTGIRALADFLQRQTQLRETEPLILLGDFNTPFSDPLLEPLRQHWHPLHAADASGAGWTYFHFRSGSRERLDGCWSPRSQPPPLLPAEILPLMDCPSDHRLLLAPLFFP